MMCRVCRRRRRLDYTGLKENAPRRIGEHALLAGDILKERNALGTSRAEVFAYRYRSTE